MPLRQYASFAVYNYKKEWNPIQKQSSCKKNCAAPQEGYCKKRCEIQGGSQEMAVMVG